MGEVYSRVMQADYATWMQVAEGLNPDAMGAMGLSTLEFTALSRSFGEIYEPGKRVEKERDSDLNHTEVNVIDGDLSFTSASEFKVEGMNAKMLNKLKVNLCPDAAGQIHLELSTTASLSRGSRGSNTRIDVAVTGYVDDDAQLGDMEIHQHIEAAAFGGSAGTFVDVSRDNSSRGGAFTSGPVNRRSSQTTDADVGMIQSLAAIVELMAIGYVRDTRAVWEKGGCVTLDTPSTPAKRTDVKPKTSFEVLAQPRSRVDGSSVGGTVRGELTGEASLDPAASKVRADAKFAYVAPGERGKRAMLKFEARSRRGIANAEMAFNTSGDAYHVEGGADEFHGAGEACDLGQPFFIEGSGVTVRFEPNSANEGRYSYSGSMSGFRVHGHGTYTVNYRDETAVSISAHGPGSVETPMGTQTAEGSEKYTLSPADAAECAGP
jgi:hypothetical protein